VPDRIIYIRAETDVYKITTTMPPRKNVNPQLGPIVTRGTPSLLCHQQRTLPIH